MKRFCPVAFLVASREQNDEGRWVIRSPRVLLLALAGCYLAGLATAIFWPKFSGGSGSGHREGGPASSSVPFSPDQPVAAARDLWLENTQLREANAQLQRALAEADSVRRRAEAEAAWQKEVADKLLDPALEVPETFEGAALLVGQLRTRQAAFRKQWEANPPTAGSPEAVAYEAERTELASGAAALATMFAEDENLAEFWKPENAARFQSVALQGAVELSEGQWRQVDGRLESLYQEALARGLDGDARPSEGLEGWRRQRQDLSERAFREIAGLLTPAQAEQFRATYSSGDWLWTLTKP